MKTFQQPLEQADPGMFQADDSLCVWMDIMIPYQTLLSGLYFQAAHHGLSGFMITVVSTDNYTGYTDDFLSECPELTTTLGNCLIHNSWECPTGRDCDYSLGSHPILFQHWILSLTASELCKSPEPAV